MNHVALPQTVVTLNPKLPSLPQEVATMTTARALSYSTIVASEFKSLVSATATHLYQPRAVTDNTLYHLLRTNDYPNTIEASTETLQDKTHNKTLFGSNRKNTSSPPSTTILAMDHHHGSLAVNHNKA
ncbi:hypothetical protein LR48_Vigan304s000400 [Vigna angularis]|uniref:Uncharacterized protein n=1 Tax=Phaseolus angularis TaxID=3914 RepID=A0A0L9T7U1_PHAAN|nr:hypothetical protein LR48_Vigan304s000400 [Vigna angularis]